MKQILLVLSLLTLLFAANKPSIAVINFEGHPQATVLSDAVISELSGSNKWLLVSRSEISKIIQEQEFQLSGIVTDSTCVELGLLVGAEFIVTGSVSKIGINYFLSVKMIDVENGQVIASASEKGMSINTLSTSGIKKIVAKLNSQCKPLFLKEDGQTE